MNERSQEVPEVPGRTETLRCFTASLDRRELCLCFHHAKLKKGVKAAIRCNFMICTYHLGRQPSFME